MTARLPASEWGAAGVARAGPSARGCRLRLRALAAMEHGPGRIARALGDGTSTRAVQRILRGQTKEIPARQLARISRLYEAWWDLIPPERTPDERAAAAAARRAQSKIAGAPAWTLMTTCWTSRVTTRTAPGVPP